MKKVVISGSAKLEEKINYWLYYFKNKNYNILDYPVPIQENVFLEEYPNIHKNFFKAITNCDILFIMNEDKNGLLGYIGPSTFSELAFGIVQNLIYNKNIEIILLQLPDENIPSYDEISLWLKLGWIKLYKEHELN